MTISTSQNTITLNGNIKSVSDYQSIKSTIDSLAQQHKSITIDLLDSISITSSVIGYFNKLVLKDKIDLHINVGSEQLMELFDDLNLTSLFKVKRNA